MSLARRIGSFVDGFLGGRGEHSITVPVMDGALKPNNYLERVPSLCPLDGVDNLTSRNGSLLMSSGRRVFALDPDGAATELAAYGSDVTCIAASPGGTLASGLAAGGIVIAGGSHDGKHLGADGSLGCPTAAYFLGEETLAVCNGSSVHNASEWSRDLLANGRTGNVSEVELATGKVTTLASGLAYPSGVCVTPDGRLVISEAWKHRLMSIDADEHHVVLADLPAYPGRLAPAASGGYWLSAFAVRSQLQEFVLREERYKREMMATIDPEFWIAPALSSGRSFKEPLQSGGVIRLGIHKPWAPTRSYGLLVRLDEAFQPVWSAHSRADGRRHGITSAVEHGARLYVSSKGNGEVLVLDHLSASEPDDLSVLEPAA